MDDLLIILVPHIYVVLLDLCLIHVRRYTGLFIAENIQSRLS